MDPVGRRRGVMGWLLGRYRLRTAMIVIAVQALALVFAVQMTRRHSWYLHMAQVHTREADRLERALVADRSPTADDADARLRAVHWHDHAGRAYYEAAFRPWTRFRADPSIPYCDCKSCRARPWLPPEALRVPDGDGPTP